MKWQKEGGLGYGSQSMRCVSSAPTSPVSSPVFPRRHVAEPGVPEPTKASSSLTEKLLASKASASPSASAEDESGYKEELQAFEKERHQFEQEKKELEDAMQKLETEKAALEQTRAQFEGEKARFDEEKQSALKEQPVA